MLLRIPACMIALWTVPLIGWAQTLRVDTVAAAPACPAPSVDTTGWLSVAGTDVPAAVRLPRNFQEKHYDVTVGEIHRQEWRGELFTTFAIERRAGPDSLG